MIKWANFCQHPDFNKEGYSKEQIISKIKSRRYLVCSSHFLSTDFKTTKTGKRNLVDDARPVVYGSAVTDKNGFEVSPIKPSQDKHAARLQGLRPNVSNDSNYSDVSFGGRDSASDLSQIEARFEEISSNLEGLKECNDNSCSGMNLFTLKNFHKHNSDLWLDKVKNHYCLSYLCLLILAFRKALPKPKSIIPLKTNIYCKECLGVTDVSNSHQSPTHGKQTQTHLPAARRKSRKRRKPAASGKLNLYRLKINLKCKI